MDKKQEFVEVSKLVFELTVVGARSTDLDELLERLCSILAGMPQLHVRRKAAILLLNPRSELVQVAQYGLSGAVAGSPSVGELDGVVPQFRPATYATSLAAERGSPSSGGDGDERFLVLPLAEDGLPMGVALIFIDNAWRPDDTDIDFLNDLARALSSLVTRCLINETLQVREIELQEARTDAIRRLGAASEYRDNETGMHVMRMTHFAGAIAKAMGLSEEERELLLVTAPMHDVGKIGIADAILLKPGRLDHEEFEVMKAHTEIGSRILAGDDVLIATAREIAIGHHEHWDGTGYPCGLRGEEIPLLARICSIADVFDALTSVRPYKEAWPVEQAVEWIRDQAGRKFDPAAVVAFEKAMPEILRIRALYRDDIIDPAQALTLPEPERLGDEYVAWDDSLSIGIDTIDAHHRYLVSLINDLYVVVKAKRGARHVARVLKALGQYAQVHFRAEERMMEHYGHAALDRQVHQHHRFEAKVKEFSEEMHFNPLTAQFDMLAYLREWLLKHIRVEDAQLRSLVVAG